MQIQFLGGAGGVGATCQLVSISGRRILVDAGVRVDGKDRLPDLAALADVSLDAILITHAHADHIGALPLVADRFPAVPIYGSPATLRLMEVMLGDAVRVMARRAADELELPLYDEALVAATLRRLRPLVPGPQTLPELGGVTVHTQRAGHIAGAVSIGLEAGDGRLVISGDVSATPQRTILGVAVPAPRRPDLLVLESTYGARLHPNRNQEERRLAEAVAGVIERGGHCLIPAFALGRAQEVILILRAAQRDGLIPNFPIAVDGLVRAVCGAYAAFPDALTPALRRHILAGGRPFFGKTVQPIERPEQRERVLAGEPAAIISSSGMLSGGPSVWYAERLVGNPQAAIFFSGYLDDEAPGRRLLDLADAPAESRRLKLGDRELPVACEVGRYSLSAHADGDELAALVRALQPRTVALVHGDPEARAALAARLRTMAEVLTPQDGQTLTAQPAQRGGRKIESSAPTVVRRAEALGAGRTLDGDGLAQIWEALRDGSGVQALSVRELAHAWYGETLDAAGEEATTTLLEAGSPYFASLPQAPGLWRLLTPAEVRRVQAAGVRRAGPGANSTAILAEVDQVLGAAEDLYQRSVDPDSGAVTLRYFFPAVAEQRDAAIIARLQERLGVPVSIWPQPHQGQLAEAALACLPAGLQAERAPAIHLDRKVVELRCTGATNRDTIAAAEAAFAAQTGWQLRLRTPDGPATSSSGEAEIAPIAPPPGSKPAELNFALNTARTWFDGETGCYKASADQSKLTVTLRFHFPAVAQTRYAAQLAELAAFIGWSVQIWPRPHQDALLGAARAVLPTGLTALGNPAIQSASGEVHVKTQGDADADAIAAAEHAFAAQTGWRLVIIRR